MILAEAAGAANGLSTGDLFAAGVTIFCFIVIPLVIWLLRVVLNEAKRRTSDSINLASIAKSNNELNDRVGEFVEKTDERFGRVGERLAALEAITPPPTPNGSNRSPR